MKERKLKEYKSAVIASDFHIFDNSTEHEVYRFCQAVRMLRPELLVLNGDIADPWRADYETIRNTESWQKLQRLIADRYNAGLDTAYINGNHDYLSNGVPKFQFTVGGRVYECRHGWEFDFSWNLLNHIASAIAVRRPSLMIPIYNLLFKKGTPAHYKEQDEEAWTSHVGIIQIRACQYAHKYNKFVIIGHTHFPAILDKLVADSGDMVDSFSFLQIRGDKVELRYLNGSKGIKPN